MASAAPAAEETSLVDLVRQACADHPGDMPGATQALCDVVTSDPDLLADLMPRLLRAWATNHVGTYIGNLRLDAARSVGATDQGGARLRSSLSRSLFDWPLPGGKRLGDANAQEILEAARFYQSASSDAAHKARWLRAVAERVGRKNRAAAALKLPELEALFKEAEHV